MKTRSACPEPVEGSSPEPEPAPSPPLSSEPSDGSDPTSEIGQQMIRTAVIETLRAEAHTTLPPMVERLAAKYGFSYNGLTIKNIHSKWGSCSATNHLNFSLYMMLLPDELIEFIILHELCHTVHKNHSAHFHALLNSVVGGNEQSLNRKLRQFHATL